jgi:hypothetical protein
MQRREKILLGVLLSVVVGIMSRGMLYSLIVEPFESRREKLARLQKSVSEKEDQLLLLARSSKALKAARLISLPSDGGKLKRPDALQGQRVYMQWLTDIAELCEIEDLKVSPDRRFLNGNEFISVVVRIEADARYEQLVRFLDLLNRADLLHRIPTIHVSTREFEGDPLLKVQLDAEGIALVDAPSRQTLFPQADLMEPLSETDTILQVEGTEGFPKAAGFKVRVKNEFLTVTGIDAEGWTVIRGVEQTQPTAHPEDSVVELVREKNSTEDRSAEFFSELVASNIFLKPAPPYKMKLIPLPDKPYARGKPVEFTIGVQGYDASRGKPEFSLVGTPPADLKLEKSGKLTWKPGPDVKADKYPVEIEVRHPSGVLTETISIRLRDSSVPPKLATTKPPVAYLNSPWRFQPELSTGEASKGKYTWKLGSTAPKGLTIDSKTGELSWEPGDEIPPGDTTVPLTVTDNESPPQTTTLQLKIDVADDEASFTRLSGTFMDGNSKRAFLYDPSKNKTTELREGEKFTVADLSGTVKQIRRKYVILVIGEQEIRLDAGQSLRDAQAAVAKREQDSLSR